jgi:DNA-directed RNA polymerase subunit RPC12/RpoP
MTIANQSTIKHFPCPGCGAKLEFNPKAKQLKCPYCAREEAIPQTAEEIQERSYEDYLKVNRSQTVKLSDTALEASCPGCRARVIFEPPDTAGKCPFCGTGIVAQAKSTDPIIAPEAVLPCAIAQKEARDRIRKWLSNRWFAPDALKKMAQQEGIQGVYLPYWTYDTYTISHYNGQQGEHYYVTETYTTTNSDGETVTETREVCHTRWYPVSGTVERFFDDVLIPSTTRVPQKQLDRLEPWDLGKVVPYNPAYLAGFKAQRYQVPLEMGFETAKVKMAKVIESDVRCDIGGDEQQIDSVSTGYSAITFKHILLPVWLSAYRFNNKQYQVIVNAHTGQVLGDRPYSTAKIAMAVAAGLLVLIGGIWAISQLKSRSSPSAPSHLPGKVIKRSSHSLPSFGNPRR